MTGYLLDTNVISEVRKPKPHGAVVEWVASLNPKAIYIPAIALFELQAGVELTRSQDQQKAVEIEQWIDALCTIDNILPMDKECFRVCARLMHGISGDLFADAMIAATALVNHLTVATRNVRDYRHFEVATLNPFTHPR